MQLGWAYFRADTDDALHCRLGGDPATVGGESVILGTEDNVATVAMFTGRSAPLATAARPPVRPGMPRRRAARMTLAYGCAATDRLRRVRLLRVRVVAAGFSVLPSPSLELDPDSPSFAPALRPPRP